MRSRFVDTVSVCLLMCIGTTVQAGLIKYTIEGTVAASVSTPFGGSSFTTSSIFSSLIGNPFTITLLVDDTPQVAGASTTQLHYDGTYAFNVGGLSGNGGTPYFSGSGSYDDISTVQNGSADFFASNGGTFDLNGFNDSSSLGSFTFESYQHSLFDSSGAALSSLDLPLAIDVNDFDFDWMQLRVRDAGLSLQNINASIDSVSVHVVPLPATYLLLAAGLASLGPMMRRSSSNPV
ncbi:MAG: hypothetical protein J5I92_06975 [Thiogranum sp.]|nr:hypothetical protein [Thiogranum sp.]